MTREERFAAINEEAARRILVLDGSMGAYIQTFGLKEDDFRSGRFHAHNNALRGNTDVLSLTRPDLITRVHEAYIESGVDIIATNTFSATTISQAEYDLQESVRDLNVEGARLAREACDRAEALDGPRAAGRRRNWADDETVVAVA